MRFHTEIKGIDQIAIELGIRNTAIILDWRLGYDLPIVKKGGIWTADKAELKKWRAQHPELTDKPPVITRIEQKPRRVPRWGLDKFF